MIAAALVLAGVMLGAGGLALTYRRREASWPTAWTIVGSAPLGTDRALRLLEALAPAPIRPGGTVTFCEPFVDFAGRAIFGGIMDSALPVRVRIVRLDCLAEEIAHAWWIQVFGYSGEGQPEFVAWVQTANAVLRDAGILP